jgi:predicted phage terminase large subunit-like protein
VQLTVDLVEALSGVYLSPRYDQPQPTPEFHRECWRRYCSSSPACATAAPRNHAKSTALTHDYTLAAVLFRAEDYVIVVGSSEDMAIEHLGDIANELRENEDIIRDFKIKDFITDQKTDIIVECHDGHQFRLIARGAEQKIRGRKWRGKRPGLIIFDDIEDDEQVESKDRRTKFRRWFFRACKQSLRDGGKIRGHGTILHEDSLLNRLMRNKVWDSKLYKAHKSFSEFTDILWPEKFPVARLQAIRQEFINEGDAGGYSQEYLNDPFDNDLAYLWRDGFIAMEAKDFEKPKRNYVGVDFAISTKDKANRTSFTVGGKCVDNLIHVIDQRVGRWDSEEIIETFFDLQGAWKPDMFFVEDGMIWKAIRPILEREMRTKDVWIPYTAITPVSDKKVRGRSFQKRMKARGMRFAKETYWYDEYEAELQRFTGDNEAVLDDQFDSTAILCRGVEDVKEVEAEDFETDSEIEFAMLAEAAKGNSGRNRVTGY